VKEQEHTSKTANCTFSGGLVPIDLKRFTDSGISLVECASLWKNAFALPGQGRPPVQTAHPAQAAASCAGYVRHVTHDEIADAVS
jgi:hypothetical protein